MSDTHSFFCCECDATVDFACEYDGDMPEGWFRLEDRVGWMVLCSVRCLVAHIAKIESPVSAGADGTGPGA